MNAKQIATINLPNEWQEMSVNQKFDWIKDYTPFSYVADGASWSSGIWSDGNAQTINNGGGSFKWFGDAVAAFERFIIAIKNI